MYGASKLVSDKLLIAGNHIKGDRDIIFSIVRYGNVMGSRGSIIPLLLDQMVNNKFTLTDKRMTRFMISLDEAVNFVWNTFTNMVGGEIYVKKIPSMKLLDIAKTINKNAKIEIIGKRPGEKLHEQMISSDDAEYTYEYKNYYKILPAIHNWSKDPYRIKNGKKVKEDFLYSSDTNSEWMTTSNLKNWIKNNKDKIGKI